MESQDQTAAVLKDRRIFHHKRKDFLWTTKRFTLKTPPTRLFFKAAVPGSIGMLASSIYQLVDGMLVGQLLGNTAFAALNLAMPFVIINFALADLIGVGSSVSISIRLGEKNEKEASNLFTCAV